MHASVHMLHVLMGMASASENASPIIIQLPPSTHQHPPTTQVLGCFANGRLEQWLPVRNLEAEEMLNPAIATAIAQKLCTFHQLRVPGLPTVPTLFDTIRKWYVWAVGCFLVWWRIVGCGRVCWDVVVYW